MKLKTCVHQYNNVSVDEIMNHYTSLSKEDLYMRFMSTVSTNVIKEWVMSAVSKGGYFILLKDQTDDLIAVGCLTDVNNYPSIAISISPSFRNIGLASKLINKIIDVAKENNVKTLHFECLRDNSACRKAFSKLGFESKYNFEIGCVEGYLTL
jgi:RimJ/RimL family protein N-acetyltransferase